MIKKIILYGLAFGSLSAAMLYIQFANGLYRERSFLSALPVIANIVLPGIGVYLFIRSISNMQTDKPINMGRGLFGSLLVCVIVAICNIGIYQHVMFNRTDIVKDIRFRNFTMIESNYNRDTSLSEAAKVEKITVAKDNFDQNISVSSFGRTQFMMCLSTGMVVALITFLGNSRRQK